MRSITFLPRSFYLFLMILISLFTQCKFEEELYIIPKITGQVQKGPFINGTEVQMYGLHSSLDQSGKIYSTVINNNKGSFAINNVELSSQYVSFSASGYYFNEITGEISSSPITLFAISYIQDLTTVNLNLMTHLEKSRVEFLVGKKIKTFQLAKETAQAEILSIFGFSLEEMDNSETLDISQSSEENAILLAVSIILQGNRSVGDLTELLANIITDMEQDGILDDKTILPELRSSTLSLNLANIRSNLESRYAELGITTTVPDFEKYIYLFLGFTGGAPVATTLAATNVSKDGATLNATVNANSLSTTVTFEYGKTTDYGSTIGATPGIITGIAATNLSALLTGLDEGSTYHYRINAVNSMGTTYGEDKSFTTVNTPPPPVGLVAYYPFNGNSNDESGNGNNGTVFEASLTTDRFGKENSAYNFDGNDDYIEIQPSASLNTAVMNVISISLWANSISLNPADINRIINMSNKTDNINLDLYFTTDKKIGFLNYAGWMVDSPSSLYDGPISLNTWYHIVATLDFNTKSTSLYVNGTLVASDIGTTASRPNNPFTRIGKVVLFPTWSSFNGKIDDIRIYNKELLDAEIRQLYHEGGYGASGTVTDVDGNNYKTVQIGSQVWMAENLKARKYNDGTNIPIITAETIEGNPGYSEGLDANTYGVLYNWYAVSTTTNGGKNVCPIGWHVPTDAEWLIMEEYLGNNGYNYDNSIGFHPAFQNKISKSMATASLIWMQSVTEGAIGNEDFPEKRNITGLSIIPTNGSTWGFYWSSTSALTTLAWSRDFCYNEPGPRHSAQNKQEPYAIRCIKN